MGETTFHETAAGETIEVWDDADVLAAIGAPDDPRTQSLMLNLRDLRHAVVTALWHHGTFAARTGFTTDELAHAAGLDRKQVRSVLKSPTMEFAVDEETRGKRSYRISLVAIPRRWLPELLNGSASAAVDVEPEPDALPRDISRADALEAEPAAVIDPDEIAREEYPERVPDLPPPPEIDPPTLEVAHAVATSLLTQVVEIIVAGHGNGHEIGKLRADYEAMSGRLSAQLDETQRLRRTIREVGDELAALKFERDGLRQRLRAAEHNLTVATQSIDVQRVVDAEVRKRLDQMMREVPRTGTTG